MARTQPHLLHVFSTFVPAGPETRAVRLIEGAGHEFRHSIVAMDGRLDAAALFSGKYDVRLLEAPPRAGSWATLRRMRALLVELRPSALLTYNWGAFDAVIAARSLRYGRVIHHEDGFNQDEAREFKARRVWARRLVLPRVHRVIVPSRRLEHIARERWKLAAEQVACIPNGIDLARFQPADGRPSLRHRLGIPARAPLVGWVGHLRPEKNPLRFLQAAARVDPELGAHFLVLGDGPERAACEELAAKTPTLYGRTHFTGHVQDPREHYRALDLFCISSDTEQMPIALVEAMASALPVVSTDVGDVRAMLAPGQDGWVLGLDERETAWPLAERLTALLRDADERARLGRANREKALRDYGFETMLAAHREVWRSAARGSPANA
ncbi:MAG: glycosyltransferase family 4 protein [Planctomycetes bacterium]|nr:glycosyltransferase family 4 protein [Planctomycetota bacterium]